MMLLSSTARRRAAVVIGAGLVLGVVPAVAASAAALPHATMTLTDSNNNVGHDGSFKIYRPQDKIDFKVVVKPNKAGQNVTITVQRLVTGTYFDLGSDTEALESNSTRNWSVVANGLAPGGTYRAQVSYGGDKANSPSTSNYVNWRETGKQTDIKPVKITFGIDSEKSGGFYPAGKQVSATLKVAPNKKGNQGHLAEEQLKNGKWVAVFDRAQKLDADSQTTFKFAGGASGTTYRVRGYYLGDAASSRNSSPWITLKFLK